MSRTATRSSVPVFASLAALVLALACGVARAQQPGTPAAAAPDMPRPQELEPAVDTSRTPPAPAQEPVSQDGGARGAAPAAAASAPVPSAKSPPPAAAAPSAAASQAASKGKGGKAGPDRLQLDATEITGNRELPKVLYIVPWKHSDLGDLAGKPVNSLLDEVLQPLDRDVFTRENRYYDALQPGQATPKADAVQGSGTKP